MTRIGLAYVSGAVPGFEDFGNLPKRKRFGRW